VRSAGRPASKTQIPTLTAFGARAWCLAQSQGA